MLKRILTLALSLLLCAVPLAARAEAAPEGVPSSSLFVSDSFAVESGDTDDPYNYITIKRFQISSPSTELLSFTVELSTSETMAKLGFKSLTVQHWNGTSWEDCWSTGAHYAYSDTEFSYSNTYSAYSGESYRIYAVLYAEKTSTQYDRKPTTSSYILCR